MARHTSQEQRDIMYLFERPSDPLYMPRSGDSVVFNVPSAELPTGFAPRFGDEPAPNVIEVNVDGRTKRELPPTVRQVPRGGVFSINLRHHRIAARDVITVLERAANVAELRDLAASIRDDVNETLMVYALSSVIMRSKTFRGLRVPSVFETFPGKFLPTTTIERARTSVNRGNSNRNANQSEAVVLNHDVDFSGFRSRAEGKLAYWREDYGLNAHHWHWHLVFPSDLIVRGGVPDRKGELFYYMHQQIVARYDMERMSIGMARVQKLDDFRAPIPEGYYPKLEFSTSEDNANRLPVPGIHPNATQWGSRQNNTVLGNYARLNLFIPVDITELELWRDRLLDGIHQGFFFDNQGERVPLSDEVDISARGVKRGIDILGDAFEADPNLSVNYQYLGDLHNFGHVVISAAHDPDGSHGENLGVMSESATAMRDPVFYRWHKYIDWIFQQYKSIQPSYTVQQLSLADVRVVRVGVATGTLADELHTGWRRREFEASRGIDFGTAQSVRVRLQHLDHSPFDTHILVQNDTGASKQVYVRVFLAPRDNDRGEQMRLIEQRHLFAELDKFVFELKPGQNHIKRPSSQSSVTVPGDLTFRDLEHGIRGQPLNPNPVDNEEDFCGCGWPQHLLLPRGRPEGMAFQLFVMLTDYDLDRVPAPPGARTCASASSYCGVLDERYPDMRPMGFPFDRLPPRELRTPQEQVQFVSDLAALDNVAVHDINIRFLGDELTTTDGASSQ